jgi:uncharacterized protein
MRNIILTLGVLAMAASPALAQTPHSWGEINCSKAKTADEKAICGSTDLVQRDSRMSVEYGLLRGFLAMGGRGALMDEQKAWLGKRAVCKADKACLRKVYDERIVALETGLDRVKTFGPF